MADMATESVEVAKIAAATQLALAIVGKFGGVAGNQDASAQLAGKTYATIYAAVDKAYKDA